MNQQSYPYMPFFQMGQLPFMQNQSNDLINRIERLEREIKRLESRVYRLEKDNIDTSTSLCKEYVNDDGLYMV